MESLVAAITVVIITVIRGGQATPCCQVIPDNYSFNIDHICNFNRNYLNNCSIDATLVTCQTPNTLTDNNAGAAELYYYDISFYSPFDFLFTFHSEVQLTRVTLHYMTVCGCDGYYGLPAMKLYAVPDDYELESELYEYTVLHTINPKGMPLFSDNNIEYINISSTQPTRKILLRRTLGVDHFDFLISEVMFFTDSETKTISPSTNYEYQDTSCSDGLLWAPTATIFAALFFGLLIVNIVYTITCMWCICKKWKKKDVEPTCRLEVQDNPCYGPLGGEKQNPDTGVHTYDTVYELQQNI